MESGWCLHPCMVCPSWPDDPINMCIYTCRVYCYRGPVSNLFRKTSWTCKLYNRAFEFFRAHISWSHLVCSWSVSWSTLYIPTKFDVLVVKWKVSQSALWNRLAERTTHNPIQCTWYKAITWPLSPLPWFWQNKVPRYCGTMKFLLHGVALHCELCATN